MSTNVQNGPITHSSLETNCTLTPHKGGSFDQKGLVRDLLKNGFTIFTSYCELIANIYDASGEKVCFINDPMGRISGKPAIYQIGNGSGMSIEELDKRFCCLYAQNHKGQETSGISGKGAKAALVTLSEQKAVCIYSKKGDGFSKAEIPYDKILDRNDDTLWEGGITFNSMSGSEIEMFNSVKKYHEIPLEHNGTLIEIPYSKLINDELDKQFLEEQRKVLVPEHRFDFVFGKQYAEQNFAYLNLNEGVSKHTIQPYQYFGGEDHLYYKGTFKSRIDVYKKNDSDDIRFIWKAEEQDKSKWFEIGRDGRGWRKEVARATTTNGYKIIGELTWSNAMRKDSNLFDESNPSLDIKLQKHSPFGAYNSSFIDCSGNIGTFSERMADAALIRNNQRIGQFPIDDFKGSSARANKNDITGGFAKICLFQSELSYSVTCSQDNVLDRELGIQSNKNQINHEDFPKPLARLLTDIKSKNWDKVSTHFKTKTSEYEEKVRKAKKLQYEAEIACLEADDEKNALLVNEVEQVRDNHEQLEVLPHSSIELQDATYEQTEVKDDQELFEDEQTEVKDDQELFEDEPNMPYLHIEPVVVKDGLFTGLQGVDESEDTQKRVGFLDFQSQIEQCMEKHPLLREFIMPIIQRVGTEIESLKEE